MGTEWGGWRCDPRICPSIVLVLVLSAAVLVLETAHHVVVVEHRDHAWHCFAIQSPTAFTAIESQRDGQMIASDANPRLRGRANSQSRNATACVDCGCDSDSDSDSDPDSDSDSDSEHEHEHGDDSEHEHEVTDG